ncbi:MAG: DUF2079 domain-containing protein [Actinobacteria bacterium]|nr:DUF2079 domain-containing protein [Actinomycetota bacterium]
MRAVRRWRHWADAEDHRPLRTSFVARVALVAVISLAIGAWSAWGIRRHNAFGTFGFDFGIFDQGVWLLSRFKSPFITIMGVHLFGDHTSFILLPLVPFYWLFPSAKVLIVAQAAALSMAAAPLFLIAREKLRSEWLALGVAVAFLANPALQWEGWEQFHPDVFEVPLALAALYFMTKRRWGLFLVVVFALLMVKEDVPLMTFMLGLYVARKYNLRVGLLTAFASLLWFAGAVWLILPTLNGEGTLDAWRVPYGGMGGLIKHTLLRPWDVVALALEGDKSFYAWQLFASFGLLALLAPTAVLIAAGPLASNLLSTFWYQYHLQYHYTTLIVAVLAFATVIGLAHIQRFRLRTLGVGLLLGASGLTGWMWGPSQYARNPEALGDASAAHVGPIHHLLAKIPAGAAVSSHYSFVTHLDHRDEIYEFPVPWYSQNWGDGRRNGALLPQSRHVDYIVIVESVLNDRDRGILRGLEESQFERIGQTGDIVLLKRSAPAPRLGTP